MTDSFTSRRTVLAAAGTTGLAVSLAACGDSGSDSGSGGDGDTGGATDGGEPDSSAEETGQPDGDGGDALAEAADIPEGGGKIFTEEKVVVTQPEKGEYKAFSAVCQHKGCLVTDVQDGTINCACHGSKYDIADGSVTNGPATKGLPGVEVTVEGGSVQLG